MKNLFRVLLFIVISFSFSACGQLVTATPSPIPSPTWTPTATFTPIPSLTATATVEPSPSPAYIEPTLAPTIDPTLVPDLLSKALSIQTMEGENRHNLRQITGWEYGFGAGIWQYSCSGFDWLDTNHLVLYPSGGEINATGFGGTWYEKDVVPQSVIINLETGTMWLPPVRESLLDCNLVSWSQELGILINLETPNDTPTVSTYTYDGRKLSSYTGQISAMSPSGTKILFEDNTLIDLRTNKRITLDWSLEDYYEPHLSSLYWGYPDETRIYRCCYFYADLTTGVSHRFQRSDFQDTNGNHLDAIGLWFHQGEWVRDNKYFLVHWLAVDDGPVSYLPMFNPATKLFYDVWEMAGIPAELTWLYNDVSPDGNHVWIAGRGESYLVDLITFKSLRYPYQEYPYTFPDTDWSADSKFIWFQNSDSKATEFQIVSIADKKSSPLPIIPRADSYHEWHPSDSVAVYPSADQDRLIFLDVTTMSYRELAFNLQKQSYGNTQFAWSPNGEKLALIAEDNSVWQVDYPGLGNLEQLTPSLPDLHGVVWSPDGSSIAFISGPDIFIVETSK